MYAFRQVAVRAKRWNGRGKRALFHIRWLIIAETGGKLYLHVNGLVLVTDNTKDFARFRELEVENWSKRQTRG